MRQAFFQLVRFGVVGVLTNALGYSAYLVITYLGVPYKLAMTLLYGLGITLSFLGHSRVTFTKGEQGRGVLVRFLIAHGLGYSLNLGLLHVFVDQLHYPHQLVQACCIVVVAVFLFVLYKLFVFREKKWM